MSATNARITPFRRLATAAVAVLVALGMAACSGGAGSSSSSGSQGGGRVSAIVDGYDASRFNETQAGRKPIVLSRLHHRASASNKVREGGEGDDDRHCNQNSSVYHPLTLKPQRHDGVL